ncbi:hypothetical protein BDW66DRAFT_130890 [Aspergillus desertorum]
MPKRVASWRSQKYSADSYIYTVAVIIQQQTKDELELFKRIIPILICCLTLTVNCVCPCEWLHCIFVLRVFLILDGAVKSVSRTIEFIRTSSMRILQHAEGHYGIMSSHAMDSWSKPQLLHGVDGSDFPRHDREFCCTQTESQPAGMQSTRTTVDRG